MTKHVRQTLPFPWQRLVPMQSATIDLILDLCTRYPLQLGGLRSSVKHEVCSTLLRMINTGNRAPDPLILSQMPIH